MAGSAFKGGGTLESSIGSSAREAVESLIPALRKGIQDGTVHVHGDAAGGRVFDVDGVGNKGRAVVEDVMRQVKNMPAVHAHLPLKGVDNNAPRVRIEALDLPNLQKPLREMAAASAAKASRSR